MVALITRDLNFRDRPTSDLHPTYISHTSQLTIARHLNIFRRSFHQIHPRDSLLRITQNGRADYTQLQNSHPDTPTDYNLNYILITYSHTPVQPPHIIARTIPHLSRSPTSHPLPFTASPPTPATYTRDLNFRDRPTSDLHPTYIRPTFPTRLGSP